MIAHSKSLYPIFVLFLLLYTQVFLRVQFLALCFSPLILCLPLLIHTESRTIHLPMTCSYRYLFPWTRYKSYFIICSHDAKAWATAIMPRLSDKKTKTHACHLNKEISISIIFLHQSPLVMPKFHSHSL